MSRYSSIHKVGVLIAIFALGVLAFSLPSHADLLGLRLGAGAIETYSINPSTATATPLPTSSFAISGGWGRPHGRN